jgi:hypothetical protein
MSENVSNVTELSVDTDSVFERKNLTKAIGNWNHFCGEYLDDLIQQTSLELANTKDSAEIDLLSEKVQKLTTLRTVTKDVVTCSLRDEKEYGKGYDII